MKPKGTERWSKASGAWMRRQSLQGCIYGDFTQPLRTFWLKALLQLFWQPHHAKSHYRFSGVRLFQICSTA